MSDSKYWDDRAVKVGHTGWSNEVIYKFDQTARIETIRMLIEDKIGTKISSLLDFGGGDGTFALSLSTITEKYFHYDISLKVQEIAKKNLKYRENVIYLESLDQIQNTEILFDCIIAITVFQHIVDDVELLDTLSILKEKLNNGGKMILMDSFSTNNEETNYSHYRTFADYEKLIEKSGFSIDSKYRFYHPLVEPTESFKKYLNSPSVFLYRAVRKFSRRKIFLPADLEKTAKACVGDPHAYISPIKDDDCTRIYVIG